MMVADDAFTIEEIRSVGTPDEELVKVTFQLKDSSLWYDSGWMVLDPGRSWAVREYEVFDIWEPSGDLVSIRGTVGYGGLGSDEKPFPRSLHIEDRYLDGEHKGLTSVEDVTFSEVDFGPVDESVFTLAAYDIPELGTISRPSVMGRILGNWVFWTSLVGAVVSLVLLWTRYRSVG